MPESIQPRFDKIDDLIARLRAGSADPAEIADASGRLQAGRQKDLELEKELCSDKVELGNTRAQLVAEKKELAAGLEKLAAELEAKLAEIPVWRFLKRGKVKDEYAEKQRVQQSRINEAQGKVDDIAVQVERKEDQIERQADTLHGVDFLSARLAVAREQFDSSASRAMGARPDAWRAQLDGPMAAGAAAAKQLAVAPEDPAALTALKEAVAAIAAVVRAVAAESVADRMICDRLLAAVDGFAAYADESFEAAALEQARREVAGVAAEASAEEKVGARGLAGIQDLRAALLGGRFAAIDALVGQLASGAVGFDQVAVATGKLDVVAAEDGKERAQLSRANSELEAAKAPLEQQLTTLQTELGAIEAEMRRTLESIPPSEVARRVDTREAFRAQIAAQQEQIAAVDRELQGLSGAIAAGAAELGAQAMVLPSVPFLKSRLRVAVEEIAPADVRAMGNRVSDWQGRLASHSDAAARASEVLANNPDDAEALASLQAAMTQMGTELRALTTETSSDRQVTQSLLQSVEAFRSHADLGFEAAMLGKASAVVGTLKQEVATQEQLLQTGQAKVRQAAGAAVRASDPIFREAEREIAWIGSALAPMLTVEAAVADLGQRVDGLARLAGAYADLRQRFDALGAERDEVLGQLDDVDRRGRHATAHRDQLLGELDRTERVRRQAKHRAGRAAEEAQRWHSELQNLDRQVNQLRERSRNLSREKEASGRATRQKLESLKQRSEAAKVAITRAQKGVEEASKPRSGWKEHTVQRGQTPGGIARQYGVRDWRDIMRANQSRYPSWTNDRNLQAGWTIRVPVTLKPDPSAVARAQAELQKAKKQLEAAKSEYTATEANGRERLAGFDRQIQSVTRELAAVEQRLPAARTQATHARNQAQEQERIFHRARHEYMQLKNEYDRRDADCVELQRHFEHLNRRLAEIDATGRDLSQELERTGERLGQEQSAIEAAVGEANRGLVAYNGVAAELRPDWVIDQVAGYPDFSANGFDAQFLQAIQEAVQSGDPAGVQWAQSYAAAVRDVLGAQQSEMRRRRTELESQNGAKVQATYDQVMGQ